MKTEVLISCAITAQLICSFVFAYAKNCFSHNVALIITETDLTNLVVWSPSGSGV